MFDPYRKWLAIPEQFRPPTHYQLLGISADEQDREVIEAAAIRQSAYIRNFQSGPNGEHAGRLLTEIAAARACLLDATKRAAYDAALRPAAGNAPPVSSHTLSSGTQPRGLALPGTSDVQLPRRTAPTTPPVGFPVETAPRTAGQAQATGSAHPSNARPPSAATPGGLEGPPVKPAATAGLRQPAPSGSRAPAARSPAQPLNAPGSTAPMDSLLDELVAAQVAAPSLKPQARLIVPLPQRKFLLRVIGISALVVIIIVIASLYSRHRHAEPTDGAAQPVAPADSTTSAGTPE